MQDFSAMPTFLLRDQAAKNMTMLDIMCETP